MGWYRAISSCYSIGETQFYAAEEIKEGSVGVTKLNIEKLVKRC